MKNLDDHSWFTVGVCLVKGRTLLKEPIRERARRDLDKNTFESKGKNLMFIIVSTAFQKGS